MLGLTGRFDEGISQLREAIRLDPLYVAAQSDLARTLYRARRYDEAIIQARKTLDLDPNTTNGYTTIAYADEQKQNYAAAVQANLDYLRLSNFTPQDLVELKSVFDVSGWQNYWRKQLEMQKNRAGFEYLPPYAVAEFYLRCGEKEKAMKLLEKSFDEHGDTALLIKVEPILDELRQEKNFAYLVRRAEFSD